MFLFQTFIKRICVLFCILTDSRSGSQEQFLQQSAVVSRPVSNIVLQAEYSASADQCVWIWQRRISCFSTFVQGTLCYG